jgi:formate dehydrogenase maturation protein FdhE
MNNEERKVYRKNWRLKNLEKEKKYNLEWNKKNRPRLQETNKQWFWRNYDKISLKNRKKQLWRNYRITLEQYNQIFVDQNGLCAICGTSGKKLVVDHCHTSQQIRGLLCNNCNTGIGLLQDVPEILISAANYLKRFKGIK